MLKKYRKSYPLGGICGLIGAVMWWMASYEVENFAPLIILSAAIGGFLTGTAFWYWILERKNKTTILRGLIAGGGAGFLFQLPSAVILAVLTLFFQIDIPFDKRISLAIVYTVFGFVAPIYFAPFLFIPSTAILGGAIAFIQKKRKAGEPSSTKEVHPVKAYFF